MAKIPKVTGCEACPRNKAKGINKIMGEVHGRKVMVWASFPSLDENRAKKELVGKPGTWFWNELSRIGLAREDVDIQNVVRCLPSDRNEYGYIEMRDPSKEELKCCSVYTKQAIEKQKATVWLVLGKIAREQLFGKKPATNVFYHDEIRVFLLDHPSYFLRGGSKERLDQFRDLLNMVKQTLTENSKKKTRFSMYRDLTDFKMITTGEEAIAAGKEILREVKKGGRVAYDEEDDTVDGKRVVLCVGVCPKPGMGRVFILDHPENTASNKDKKIVRKVVQVLLTHEHQKTMHHGSYDAKIFRELLGVEVQGYWFDTQYAAYMASN